MITTITSYILVALFSYMLGHIVTFRLDRKLIMALKRKTLMQGGLIEELQDMSDTQMGMITGLRKKLDDAEQGNAD